MNELRDLASAVRAQVPWAKSIVALDDKLTAAAPQLEEVEKLEERIATLSTQKKLLGETVSELRNAIKVLETEHKARKEKLDADFTLLKREAEERVVKAVDAQNVKLHEKEVEIELFEKKRLAAQKECEATLAALADARKKHEAFLASIGAKA